MPLAIRTAEIYTTAAILAAAPGPIIPHYAICLDTGRLYQWIPGDATTADGWAVLGHVGGFAGRWHRVQPDDRGADLPNDNTSIYLAGKPVRYVIAGTLNANREYLLRTKLSSGASSINCSNGDRLTIVRLDTSAYTLRLTDEVYGTIITLPASQAWFADLRFNEKGWVLLRAGKMTP